MYYVVLLLGIFWWFIWLIIWLFTWPLMKLNQFSKGKINWWFYFLQTIEDFNYDSK